MTPGYAAGNNLLTDDSQPIGQALRRNYMSWYVVTYEIRGSHDLKDELKIEEELRKSAEWCMPMPSHWIIKSDKSAAQILEGLKKAGAIQELDAIFILETTLKGSFQQATRFAKGWLEENLQAS